MEQSQRAYNIDDPRFDSGSSINVTSSNMRKRADQSTSMFDCTQGHVDDGTVMMQGSRSQPRHHGDSFSGAGHLPDYSPSKMMSQRQAAQVSPSQRPRD